MRKVHVITQKEVIRENDLTNCTAVVIDVFLATSTIAFLLDRNYTSVYAKATIDAARDFADSLQEEVLLLGEVNGFPVDGFVYPDPSAIKPTSFPKAAVFRSTNGTVAIESSKNAINLYTSSLVNGHVIAQWLHEQNDESSIVLICSGNAGSFSLEDFVGAGQIVAHLVSKGEYDLSDAAITALDAYKKSKSLKYEDLLQGRTAQLLENNNFANSIKLIINSVEKINVLPKYESGKIVDLLKIKT